MANVCDPNKNYSVDPNSVDPNEEQLASLYPPQPIEEELSCSVDGVDADGDGLVGANDPDGEVIDAEWSVASSENSPPQSDDRFVAGGATLADVQKGFVPRVVNAVATLFANKVEEYTAPIRRGVAAVRDAIEDGTAPSGVVYNYEAQVCEEEADCRDRAVVADGPGTPAEENVGGAVAAQMTPDQEAQLMVYGFALWNGHAPTSKDIEAYIRNAGGSLSPAVATALRALVQDENQLRQMQSDAVAFRESPLVRSARELYSEYVEPAVVTVARTFGIEIEDEPAEVVVGEDAVDDDGSGYDLDPTLLAEGPPEITPVVDGGVQPEDISQQALAQQSPVEEQDESGVQPESHQPETVVAQNGLTPRRSEGPVSDLSNGHADGPSQASSEGPAVALQGATAQVAGGGAARRGNIEGGVETGVAFVSGAEAALADHTSGPSRPNLKLIPGGKGSSDAGRASVAVALSQTGKPGSGNGDQTLGAEVTVAASRVKNFNPDSTDPRINIGDTAAAEERMAIAARRSRGEDGVLDAVTYVPVHAALTGAQNVAADNNSLAAFFAQLNHSLNAVGGTINRDGAGDGNPYHDPMRAYLAYADVGIDEAPSVVVGNPQTEASLLNQVNASRTLSTFV